ncbi:GBF-interacting protein 1-like isoform X1 [Brassica napus]|uniref:GBF-interacting protein 1-like isoform X1 n=1 Tax=Brassica napus TaxID=3708 RepID=UPI0020784B6E|nr:GBF-interacting protein 1-like isoform X1 [Brassica napus]
MGSRGGGGGGVSNAKAGGVPASSRKVVESLKEIVNCSDLEIYAMLVDCDMDPDETVSRLLSQDTFHEVKSKRDKKKETKDPAESWTRSTPNRGARSSGYDGYNTSRGGGNRFKSNERGSVQSVPVNRRENGTRNHWAGSSSTPGVLGRQPPPNSDPTNAEVKKAQPTGSNEAVTSSLLPTPAYQSAWANANPGQRTMADIVKMGRPLHQKKNVAVPRPTESQESGSKAPVKDEWPSIEKQVVSYPTSSSLLKPAAESEVPVDQFSEPRHLTETHLDDLPVASPPASVSNRNLLHDDVDDARDSSEYEDENNKVEPHAFEENRGEDVSASVATGFEQLTIESEEDHETLTKEDKPPVIIPSHLQVHTSECSHLMFGSFGLGLGSGQVGSGLNDNSEETKETEENSSFRHPESDFYREEEEQQLKNAATDEQTSYQIDSTARNYHASSDSETEEAARHEPPPLQEDHQYKFSSPADYGFENSQQLNPPSETNPQMQSLDTFPNAMIVQHQGIQDAREPDLHYSPFPTKYNNPTPSSLSGSMAEALRASSISPQNQMPSGAGEQAAALAQHLALNPYSHQPGMPLGHYGNLMSYPFMPQSYNPYMPSAFQQAFPSGNHHQSMLPQYKTQATAPPVPPPSAYGFGGGGSALSSNFPLNSTSAPNSYEDVLSSQFRDSSHLASSLQQQNEHLAAWHQGQQSNSRVVPGSGYYSHQNQQPPGFRQAQLLQQPSQQQQQQHFGGHGYGSPYHSQAPMSLDHLHHQHQQQQNARDASKQTHQQQLWPNNY